MAISFGNIIIKNKQEVFTDSLPVEKVKEEPAFEEQTVQKSKINVLQHRDKVGVFNLNKMSPYTNDLLTIEE